MANYFVLKHLNNLANGIALHQYFSVRNKDGSITITLTVAVKLINLSSTKSTLDLNGLATKIEENGKQILKGSTTWNRVLPNGKSKLEQINVSVMLSINPVNSLKEISKGDYAIAIIDHFAGDQTKFKEQGKADMNGMYAAVIGSAKVGVYVHEIGHLINLDDNYSTKTNNPGTGLMGMANGQLTFITRSDVFDLATPYITGRLNTSGLYPPKVKLTII